MTQTVEVESPVTLKQLGKARQRNELLSEKLANQNERCKQLEEQIRKSDEYSCNLQHKVTNTVTTVAVSFVLKLKSCTTPVFQLQEASWIETLRQTIVF